jgi:hypothetical protein
MHYFRNTVYKVTAIKLDKLQRTRWVLCELYYEVYSFQLFSVILILLNGLFLSGFPIKTLFVFLALFWCFICPPTTLI